MNVLLDRLQEAIDEAISDSGRIGSIVEEMRRSGYDLCLIVQSSATVSPIEAVSPMDDTQFPDFVPEPRLSSNVPSNVSGSKGEIQLTGEDRAFLQQMNISVG